MGINAGKALWLLKGLILSPGTARSILIAEGYVDLLIAEGYVDLRVAFQEVCICSATSITQQRLWL